MKMSVLRIYVANLGKYNEGELVGEWLDLPATDKEIETCMKNIRVAEGSEYEEYAIHDYECNIDGVKISEYTPLDYANELAERLESIDDEEAFAALLDYHGGDISNALTTYEKGDYRFYEGVSDHEDLGMYLYDNELLDAAYYVDEICPSHLDYEAIGRDFDYNCSGGIYNNGFLEVY